MKCWIKNKKNPKNRIKDVKIDCNYGENSFENIIGTLIGTKAIIDKVKEEKNDRN